MLRRLWNRFTYWMERKFVRGAQYRLLLIAAGVGVISVIGGAVVLAAGSGFLSAGEAIWWAFLRLTDPGYLGDDVGAVNRTVSTILTVLGYVVFLGALVAVMTQWLDGRMKRLEGGLTPVARNDHILVVGLNNRTEAIIREILLSEGRVKRFLRRHGTRELHIVVLADGVTAAVAQDLRDAVGDSWDERKVTLRSGTPLRPEHLARVDSLNAAVVIIPGSEFEEGGVGRTDSFTLKTLLSLEGEADRPHRAGADRKPRPLVVAEVFDARKVPLARKAYPGPLEIVASDAIISRLLAQNIRHPGLSHVYNEILTHEGGCEIYMREHPELDGVEFGRLGGAFRKSILLGVVRRVDDRYEPFLNPGQDFVVRGSDRFVHLANEFSHATYSGRLPERPWPRGAPGSEGGTGIERSILILGWNHKVPALMREFGTYGNERFDVRIVSTVPASRRAAALARYGVAGDHVRIDHLEGDFTDVSDLRAAQPERYEVLLLVGSDRLQAAEESDARTIVASLLLSETEGVQGAQTIVELLDPENVRLLDTSRGEIIISPLILSHMLAHVALRPELGAVFSELFTEGGAEITFRPLGAYAADRSGGTVTFDEVQQMTHAVGEIALGIKTGPGAEDLFLNPPPDSCYDVERQTAVVTMVTFT